MSETLDAIVGYTSNNDEPSERPSDTADEAGAAAASLPEESATRSALFDKAEQQMLFAKKLDFERRPRLLRSGEKEFTLHKCKQANEIELNRVLQIAYLWGYKSYHL